MTESDKERVKFNTEMIKLLVLLFIATGGGTVSLIINYKNANQKIVTVNAVFSYIIITGVFLAVAVPLVLGIIDYAKENKELDQKRKLPSRKVG